MNDLATKPAYPLIQFTGKIHLISSDADLAVVADQILTVTQFGFDTETRPSFKKGEAYPTALLQLATDENAYLIRPQKLTQFHILKTVFENTEILKTGVAIRDDLKNLQKFFKFTPQNFVELQDLAKKKGLQNFGLKGMTEEVLQARLSKAAKITNWDAPKLSPQQIMYAATDAWVGLELFKRIYIFPDRP